MQYKIPKMEADNTISIERTSIVTCIKPNLVTAVFLQSSCQQRLGILF